jgi:hypothetical protein
MKGCCRELEHAGGEPTSTGGGEGPSHKEYFKNSGASEERGTQTGQPKAGAKRAPRTHQLNLLLSDFL